MSKLQTFLKFISLNQIDYWDVKRFLNDNISFNNSYKLSNILELQKELISKEEVKKNKWRIISKINFSGELFLREINEIDTYKGSLYKVCDNQIIYSKINVRHGCIYYHQKEQEPFVVSNEYPIFKFDDTKVNGDYLRLILRSESFKKLLDTKTSGISKSRVKIEEFLNIRIPLPSLEKQNELLENFNKNILLAQKQEEEVIKLEESIEMFFNEELNIKKTNRRNQKGLKFISSKEINRWDVWTFSSEYSSNLYNTEIFKNIVIDKPFYGANEKGIKKITKTRYIRITDINDDGSLNDEIVSPEKVDEKFLLKENDFLIARSGNTVGKTFLYKEFYGRAIYAGYLVKYIFDLNKVIPEYILYFTKTEYYKNWIVSNQRVSGQPNINGQEFLYSPIILPPLNIQEKIVLKIKRIKDEVKILKEKAELNRQNAIKEFEKEIFIL